jgi:hypothetical protein
MFRRRLSKSTVATALSDSDSPRGSPIPASHLNRNSGNAYVVGSSEAHERWGPRFAGMQMKKSHPGKLIAMQVGDFFELAGWDAVLAIDAIGLAGMGLGAISLRPVQSRLDDPNLDGPKSDHLQF